MLAFAFGVGWFVCLFVAFIRLKVNFPFSRSMEKRSNIKKKKKNQKTAVLP